MFRSSEGASLASRETEALFTNVRVIEFSEVRIQNPAYRLSYRATVTADRPPLLDSPTLHDVVLDSYARSWIAHWRLAQEFFLIFLASKVGPAPARRPIWDPSSWNPGPRHGRGYVEPVRRGTRSRARLPDA
jgi:hypothetical protein